MFFIFSCGDNNSESTDTSIELSGTQAAEISGRWQSECQYDWNESTDFTSIYSTEEYFFNEGSVTISYKLYSDSSCNDYIETKQYNGTYELGDTVEISDTLFAREIAEHIGHSVFHFFYFISGDKLYFQGVNLDGEGEEPFLDLDNPYTLIED